MATLATLEVIAKRIEEKLDEAIANLNSVTDRVENIEKREIQRDADIKDVRGEISGVRSMVNGMKVNAENVRWKIGVPLGLAIVGIVVKYLLDYVFHMPR